MIRFETIRARWRRLTAAAAALTGVFLLSACFEQAQTFDQPTRVVIGLDLSKSNPLVDDPTFAAQVGDYVGDMVAGLPFRSEVTLRTFGVFDSSANTLRLDRTISKRRPPEQVAQVVEGLIAGVPQLIDEGRLQAQMRTNILPFLVNMNRLVDCRDMPTVFVLATDGVEDSEYANMARQERLPSLDNVDFRDCDKLLILGIGQGQRSPRATEYLRGEWQRFADDAGFRDFQALNDW